MLNLNVPLCQQKFPVRAVKVTDGNASVDLGTPASRLRKATNAQKACKNLQMPQPNYPEAARKRGEEGDVLLKVEVLVNGRVGQAEVEESSGFALLDESALGTVSNWRFKPALKGREEVACRVNIPIKFKLR